MTYTACCIWKKEYGTKTDHFNIQNSGIFQLTYDHETSKKLLKI